ncbi:MAG: serine/threonine protein kinase, partial [Deltaproteobacteria bacterium]|nr:serine/threonine protein kinase [Deltaproteobacteria bacterium]
MTGQLAGAKEGDVLAEKYRVEKVLGVGGMGVVVAAHHVELDERVAIKFMLPEALANSEAVARFAREARAAVKIKSEHVARVSDVGKLGNGAPYMVMEYLEGSDLSQWVESRGALPMEQAVDFLLQACEAIAEAHALGIVHRDLKPANLFVARLPGGVQSVKVLDFGISKLTGLSGPGNQSSATKTSALMGSPLYMSPEQMQSSKDVDSRGDIWALGVILYELVTGKSPFIADTLPELILKIMSSAPPPLRDLRPDAPDGLEAVLLRCLEKDRGQRYQTVGELAVALLPYGSKRSRASADRISLVMQAAGMSASALALPPSSGDAVPSKDATTAAAFGGTAPGGGKTRPALLAA